MITFLALLLLVLLGGFISYYGDLQGRRWGKKRVSWFGMRPKHTAILITSLTGAFIALISVLTLIIISPQVREVVTSGERAIRENKILILQQRLEKKANTAEINQLNAKIQQTATQKQQILTQKDQIATRLQQLQTQFSQLEQKRNELQQDQQRLIKSKLALQTSLSTLQAVVRQRQQQIRIAEHDIRDQEASNRELGRQNVQYQRENASLEQNKKALLMETARVRAANEKLKEIGLKLVADNEQLRGMNLALKNDGDAQSRKNDELQQKNTELSTRLNNVYGLFAGSERNYTQNYLALRRGRLNIRAGEMLGRHVIDSHLRPDRVRSELESLLDEASTTALLHGAGRGDNGRAVRIVTKRIVTLVGTDDANEKDSLNSLVETLTNSDTPAVVVANAVNNTIEGEQVLIELSSTAVNTVFKQGDEIASRRIDARQSFDQVLNAIADFLQEDVHKAALQGGIVPQVGGTLGHIDSGELIPLTENIRKMGGTVILIATAKNTITSADPLRLEFRLTRAISSF